MSHIPESAAAAQARHYREADPAFAHWAEGYGLIRHTVATQLQVHALGKSLCAQSLQTDTAEVFHLLAAADRVASMASWLVGHLSYARHVRLDGSALQPADFKEDPQGHTGGSLNMVPAYVAYMAANALGHVTRGWLMGQGHCVAAIEAVNALLDNQGPEQAARYSWTDAGLTRLTQDFYGYRVRADGHAEAPLGSHVGAFTAGGVIEGGYLGFAELLYPHMALPGESLVAFLSDGALEEQRGADWAARWWRAQDCGLVVPVLIANGRRIEQRSTLQQMGGVDCFEAQLRLDGFAPQRIDGTDVAAFVCAIFAAEAELEQAGREALSGRKKYPVAMPYVIAEAPKGFGFPHAGSNAAHGTPLPGNPFHDAAARAEFNAAVRALWVAPEVLAAARQRLMNHVSGPRRHERNHAMARRQPLSPQLPTPLWEKSGSLFSAMKALDGWLDTLFRVNPALRVRVGNPDELHSNGLDRVLASLCHRSSDPEPGNHEAINGAIITALNEEAVVCAALGNKGGLNLVVSYEAFAVKMLGALRQDIIFAQHAIAAGSTPGWISMPLLASSHTWENGKNEQSHQDPTLSEALLAEMSHVARVLFPPDANAAMAALASVYASRGVIAELVVSKQPLPVCVNAAQALQLTEQGALVLQAAAGAVVELVAIGAYQLREAIKACARLTERGVAVRLICMQEPARFREPRDRHEAAVIATAAQRHAIFSETAKTRVFLVHTRAEIMSGVLRPLDLGPAHCRFLGYRNRGGTLDAYGMLYANACTWAHAVAAVAQLQQRSPADFLTEAEWLAVCGEGDPYVLIPAPHTPSA
ncbi:MAG: hypothetical protein ACRERR_00170 [Moraxellaceae bacterium]